MQKYFRGGSREWFWIALGAILLAAALLWPLGCALANPLSAEEQTLLSAYEEGQIIRIHIIANSNSEHDQAIKLHVRDTLIERFGALLGRAGQADADAAFQLLVNHADTMLETAKAAAMEYGFEGQLSAETGFLHLSAKQYGQILLPEGEYRALRITLGEGKGENWWCVLYPQLCLSLSQTEEITENQLFWKTKRIFQCWLAMK